MTYITVSYRLIIVPRFVAALMGRILKNWLAMTLGHTILAARPLTEGELLHEKAHILQWDRYGLAFVLHYGVASLRSWRDGTGWYWGNRFEVEARAYAQQDWWPE